jgi:NodT family efflux transporter outer membrane factor (OMF) lipoprotein
MMSFNKSTILRSVIILTAMVLFMSGCAVGPDFVKPRAPVPGQWMEAKDPAIRAARAEYSAWWKVFNDPVLNSLIEAARAQNLPLQIAGIRVFEARAQLGIAIGNLYPQSQQVGGSYTRTRSSQNTKDVLRSPNYNSWQMGFDATWELDVWGKFRRSIESGVGNLDATIATYDDILVTLTAEVALTYVFIRTLEARLAITQDNVKLQQRSLEIARDRFNAGEVTELDVTQAQGLLGSTQAIVPQLEANLTQTQNALGTLLGKLPGEVRKLLGAPRPIPGAPAEVTVGVPADLLRRRPDIRRAEQQAAAQCALIGAAKADLYPYFTLFGSIGYLSDSTGDLFSKKSIESLRGTGFTWNIFNYGRIINNARVQDARFQELIVNYQDTVLRAVQEAEDAMAGFIRTRQELQFRQYSVNGYQRSVALSMEQYLQGLVDFQRVIQSQLYLQQEQDLLTQSAGSVALNLIALYKALGGGWEIRERGNFIPENMKEVMRQRTYWGDLLSPKTLEMPPVEKAADRWYLPDW